MDGSEWMNMYGDGFIVGMEMDEWFFNGDGYIFWEGWLGCIWSRSGMEIDGFLEMDGWLRMEMDG